MKNLVLVLLLAAIVATSCKKDDDGDSTTTSIINPSASMTCKIDGSQWTSLTRITTLTNGNFVVNGTSLNSDVINVTILGTSIKEYNLETGNIEFSASYSPTANSVDSIYTALNGKASLTEVDLTNKKVSGTFRFNASNIRMDEISVTEGVFTKLSYTETGSAE